MNGGRLVARGRIAAQRLQLLLDRYCEASYAQEGEDRILARIFEDAPSGFYVDVGAFHPKRFSNTYLFYRRGWRGINIEPDPAAVAEFARLRPRDTHVAVGISDEPGTLTYYRFDEPALNTFDPEVAKRRPIGGRFRALSPLVVTVTTLAAVLTAHLPAGQAISFLSVDAEGYDLRVLRSNDWGRFRPRYVLSESVGSILSTLDTEPQTVFMAGAGYELFAKTVHTIFYRDARGR
jgi:FkbM family methyltransferase